MASKYNAYSKPGTPERAEQLRQSIGLNWVHLQQRERYCLPVLQECLLSRPAPWELWPAEADGDPNRWVRLVTGEDWAGVLRIMRLATGDLERVEELTAALRGWAPTPGAHCPAAAPPARFEQDGLLKLSPMLGPWRQYPLGSPKRAMTMALHLQSSLKECRRILRNADYLMHSLREAINAEVAPWSLQGLRMEEWVWKATSSYSYAASLATVVARLDDINPSGWVGLRELIPVPDEFLDWTPDNDEE